MKKFYYNDLNNLNVSNEIINKLTKIYELGRLSSTACLTKDYISGPNCHSSIKQVFLFFNYLGIIMK